jgi:2-polyprenyl-6-methoxyphenol hydroxylase-like FAD-dependent oxidoreductase
MLTEGSPLTQEISSSSQDALSLQRTTCCIVGGGPAGAMLALLLARKGVPVLLLEAHKDFDREYRADTLHPYILEILEDLGMADALHRMRHTKIRQMTAMTPTGSTLLYDFGRLKTRYPYFTMMPQAQFLAFLTEEASRYPNFQVVMGARVEHLIEHDGIIAGVRYRGTDGMHEVQADLTIGSDGRFSRVRGLAQLASLKLAPPIDLLWFKLPGEPGDDQEEAAQLYFGAGRFLVAFDRYEYWQIGYGFLKGGYQELKASGIEGLRLQVGSLAPRFAAQMQELTDWKQVSLLSIEASHLVRWYRPGLLLIGDAAHVMSPIGGVGVNLAIQDAVAAANLLSEPLLHGHVLPKHLAAVQRKRELPTRIVQWNQQRIQRRILKNLEQADQPSEVPFMGRVIRQMPLIQRLRAHLTAYGVFPPRLKKDHKNRLV